jgi:hypothetical protein
MKPLAKLHAELIHDAAAVVEAFNTATEQEPWRSLPEEERINFLKYLIRPLIEAGLSEELDERKGAMALHIAARHGMRRHEQGLPDSILIEDVYHFRRAIYTHLAHHEDVMECTPIIARIDDLLTRAFQASLYGYYRDAFEARGEWPKALDLLLKDSTQTGEEETN